MATTQRKKKYTQTQQSYEQQKCVLFTVVSLHFISDVFFVIRCFDDSRDLLFTDTSKHIRIQCTLKLGVCVSLCIDYFFLFNQHKFCMNEHRRTNHQLLTTKYHSTPNTHTRLPKVRKKCIVVIFVYSVIYIIYLYSLAFSRLFFIFVYINDNMNSSSINTIS